MSAIFESPGVPFTGAAINRLPQQKGDLTESFLDYRDRVRTVHEQREWLEIARDEIAYFSERLFNHNSSHLEAIGAVYTTVPEHSPLDAFPSRLPQHILEQAFVKKFFYQTLMTHRSVLSAYQRVEANGFLGVTGSRFPANHPLLLKTEAANFKDFGFPARAPHPDDGVEESTTCCLSSGATFSWITHKFPSQYIMGSAMPDLWSDMSLAAGASMLMITIAACDGDVSTPEKQLIRYQSAQDLIRRDPAIRLHPDRDFILPSGEKLGDFLTQRALWHLGAALKVSKNIADVYRPLIEDLGCKVVEVYDPGCTNLLEYSIAALRDRYGDSIEILAGRIPPDPDDARFFDYIKRLGKHRVTFRVGLLDGKICKTFRVTGGMAPMNIQTGARIIQRAEELKDETGHAVIVSVEGGASERLGTAIACGIAGVSISSSLAGNTIEHTPPLYEFTGNTNPLSGEAAESTKIKGGKVNAVGDPLQVEGVSGLVTRSEGNVPDSMARRLHDYSVGLTKSDRFLRQSTVIEVLTDRPDLGGEIVKFSGAAVEAAQVHII